MLRDDNLCAPVIEFGDNVVAVEGLVGKQGAELDALDQWGHADGVNRRASICSYGNTPEQNISQFFTLLTGVAVGRG